MKKLLAAILMFAMLTPSLACAMPVCADEVRTAAVVQPCAAHDGHHNGSKEEPLGKVNLLKDCMGIDLQVADNAVSIKAPDFNKDISFDVAVVPAEVWTSRAVIGNRGPPPNRPEYSPPRPSIILTTQRFRE